MIIRFFYISILIALSSQLSATDVQIRMNLIHTTSAKGEMNTYTVQTLRFYISEITYLKDGDSVWIEPEGYRLIDLADSSSLSIASYVPDGLFFDAIRFRLGVDSVSSSTGAHTGALDPAKGMYWAWHTGYVNLKIEGTCDACPSPKKEFEFHIGGFQSPFNAARTITLKANNPNLEIIFDISIILNEAFATNNFRVMSPSSSAMRMADAAAKSFYIKP